MGLLLGVGNIELTIGSVVVTGATFGPIYPTVLAVTAARFSSNAGKAAALVMAIGSVGGVIFPWLFGILLVGLGAQSVAQFIALLILVMISVFGVAMIATRRMDRTFAGANERVLLKAKPPLLGTRVSDRCLSITGKTPRRSYYRRCSEVYLYS